MLQQAKSLFRDQLGLPPAAIFVLVGVTAHLALNAILRKPLTSASGLLAPLTLGVALEVYEIWVYYKDIGLFARDSDPIIAILLRHGLDVGLMLAVPAIIVAVGKFIIR